MAAMAWPYRRLPFLAEVLLDTVGHRPALVPDRRGDAARLHDGDVDAPRRQLEAKRIRDRLQRELRCAVGADERRAIRPPIEPMLMMRPFDARSIGRNACVTATWSTTLTSSWRRSSAISTNSSGPPTPMPALFTSPRSLPSPICASTFFRASAIDAPSVTSMRSGVRRSDASLRSASPSSERRTPAKTRMPIVSSRSAQARPMPVDAPVMTTAPRVPFADVMAASSLIPRSRKHRRDRVA
jgi:hypothetical protein